MWETLAKIIPSSLLVGLLAYGCISFIWLQPWIEGRMAELKYIPQCIAGDLPTNVTPKFTSRDPSDVAQGTGDGGIPDVELPLSIRIIAEMKGLFRDGETRGGLPYQLEGGPCACAVTLAFDSVFWRSLVHVMTLRIYTPLAIEHFDQHVAQVAVSGVCGSVN